MSQITEILYQDCWKYLEQLDHEELIELVQEHRQVKRILESSKGKSLPVKIEG